MIAGDPDRYRGCTINVVSDICSGSDIETYASVLTGHGVTYHGQNRLLQRLLYPETYRFGNSPKASEAAFPALASIVSNETLK